MGILDVPPISRRKLAALSLANQFAPAVALADPPVMSSPPTITFTTATSYSSYRAPAFYDSNVVWYGRSALNYNTTFDRVSTPGLNTIDFYLVGTDVEIAAVAAGASGGSVWEVLVDGQAVSAAPFADSGITTSLGTNFFMKIAFGASGRRRITIRFDVVNAIRGLYVPIGASITAPPQLPRIAFVGDSFFAGAAGVSALQTHAALTARLLGVACGNMSYGGSSYVLDGSGAPFGGATRVADVAAFNPDLVVISGSVNDDASSGVGAAAAAAYAAYAAALPNVPLIVFGPQPSNSTSTLSTGRQAAVAAVKAAALAAPNVVAFHDTIGTAASVPAAFASGTTYSPGNLVTYQGSVYRKAIGSGTTGNPLGPTWDLVTWLFTGTGKVGTTTGNGTRDTMLNADGVHPSLDGHYALATRMAAEIRQDLINFSRS